MPKIYKKKCDYCDKYYEGYGIYFCSIDCSRKGKKRVGFKKGYNIGNQHAKGNPPNKTSFKAGYDVTKHWNWQGGINPEAMKIRRSMENRLWRESVLIRDNWTCQKTNIRGGNLVAHHINNFSEYVELRFAIDNGITLSKKAHINFHKKYGFKHNTREQIEEFLQIKYTS